MNRLKYINGDGSLFHIEAFLKKGWEKMRPILQLRTALLILDNVFTASSVLSCEAPKIISRRSLCLETI
jgi:hypothetical protein